MTLRDQTIPVPVYLLKEVADGATLVSDYIEGPSGTLSGSAALALKSIVSLIPTPPKVGDTLTAEQVGALPVGALVVDDQEDSWLVRQDGKVLYFADSDLPENRQYPKTVWGPYTLVYLPRD